MTARKDYEIINEMYVNVQSDNQISDIYIQQFSDCLDEVYQCLNKPEYLTEGVFGAGTRLKDRASAMLSGAGQALKNVPLAARAAVTGNTSGIQNPAHAARMTKVNNVMSRFNRDIQSLMPDISSQYPEIAAQIDQLNNTITGMGQQQQTPGTKPAGNTATTTGTTTSSTGGNPNAANLSAGGGGEMDGSFKSDSGNGLNLGGNSTTDVSTTNTGDTTTNTGDTTTNTGDTTTNTGDTTTNTGDNSTDNTQKQVQDPEGLSSTDDLLNISNDKLSGNGEDTPDVANPTFPTTPTDDTQKAGDDTSGETIPSSPSSGNSMQSIQMLAGQLRGAKESGDEQLANQIAKDILNFSNSSVHGAEADNVKLAAKQVLKKYGQQQYQGLNEAIDQLLHAIESLLTEKRVKRHDKWVRTSLMPGFMRK